MTELVVTCSDRVAVLTLDRPAQGNRLTTALAREIAAKLRALRVDDSIGACVLTGAGSSFCLGGDYRGAGPTAEGRDAYAQALVDVDESMALLGKPLVAAVNGDAHAGGFGLMIACDLAIAADHATFGLPEAANGLFPFIALAAVREALPKKVLFDLIYRARLMDAEEARALHAINEALPAAGVLPRAIAVAAQAGAYDARIVALGRGLYYGSRATSRHEAMEEARTALLAALEPASP